MSNLTIENVYTRHKAKELAKKHFWKLAAMMLIVVVIAYGISFGGMTLLDYLSGRNQPIIITGADTVAAALAAANAASDQSNDAVFWAGSFLLMLVNMLISGGLGLGLTSALIDLCRGEKITIGQVFSRMKHCLKALGLSLWTGLKIILWALPGYALILAFAVIAASTVIDSTAAVSEETLAFMTILPFAAIIVVLALVVPAALRYMLSTYVLADEPETSIFTCVKDSKALMKGHKWQAFKLAVPTVLIMYLMVLLAALVISVVLTLLENISATLTGIVGVVLFLGVAALMLYYIIRIALGYCIFYLNRENENAPVEEPAPAAEE